MYFCLYHINIDAIIVNRIIPDVAKGSFIGSWKDAQRFYLQKAKEYFDPIPVLPVNLFEGEVLGYSALKRLGDELYGNNDPTKHFFKGEPYKWVKEDGDYKLIIKLPFAMKKSIQLNKVLDELIIKIGTVKRHFLLPRQVANYESISARLDGQDLYVIFKGDGEHE